MKKYLFLALVPCLALLGANCKSSQPDEESSNNTVAEVKASSAQSKEMGVKQAVEAVKSSNTLKTILVSFPEFLNGVRIYTKPVSKLGDNDLGVLVNSSTEVFYRANKNKDVRQLLFVCKPDKCDRGYFLRALNQSSPALPNEGIKSTNGDLLFVVNTEDTSIIMFERGDNLLEDTSWQLFTE